MVLRTARHTDTWETVSFSACALQLVALRTARSHRPLRAHALSRAADPLDDPLRTHAPPRAANPAALLGDHARRNHTPAKGTPGPNHPLHQSSSPHLAPIRPGTWCSSAPLTPPAEIGGGFDRPFLEHGTHRTVPNKPAKNVSLKTVPPMRPVEVTPGVTSTCSRGA